MLTARVVTLQEVANPAVPNSLTGLITDIPFGECQNSTGTIPTDKLFTGQRLDSTGLYYYNARYYDPTIGRFISADSIVQNYSNPQTFNRYSYCINNPLRYIDPTGHYIWFEGNNVSALHSAFTVLFNGTGEWAKLTRELYFSRDKLVIIKFEENLEDDALGITEWDGTPLVKISADNTAGFSDERLAGVMIHELTHAKDLEYYNKDEPGNAGKELKAYQMQYKFLTDMLQEEEGDIGIPYSTRALGLLDPDSPTALLVAYEIFTIMGYGKNNPFYLNEYTQAPVYYNTAGSDYLYALYGMD